jgi:hypothetical protein
MLPRLDRFVAVREWIIQETNKQTNRQTDRQTNKQTNKQTNSNIAVQPTDQNIMTDQAGSKIITFLWENC